MCACGRFDDGRQKCYVRAISRHPEDYFLLAAFAKFLCLPQVVYPDKSLDDVCNWPNSNSKEAFCMFVKAIESVLAISSLRKDLPGPLSSLIDGLLAACRC